MTGLVLTSVRGSWIPDSASEEWHRTEGAWTDHSVVVLPFYYGGHILMGHYLNTLHPRLVQLVTPQGYGWKKCSKGPTTLFRPLSSLLAYTFFTDSHFSFILFIFFLLFSPSCIMLRRDNSNNFPRQSKKCFKSCSMQIDYKSIRINPKQVFNTLIRFELD